MSADSGLSPLWQRVGEVLDRAPVEGVLAHGLGPLAAELRRRRQAPVPGPFLVEQRASRFAMLSAAGLVAEIRRSVDGPVMLLKGPEVAGRYPASARRFGDVDILVPDADAAQAALLAHGFEEAPDPEGVPDGHHHLEPLRLPTVPLVVEVHSSPNWIASMRPPPLEELLEAAVPVSLGVSDVLAPSPVHHALILASHGWRSEPLRKLRDLVDVAAMAEGLDGRELDRLARLWGLRRVWQATQGAIDHLFAGGRTTFPLRTWASHLEPVRDRTVLEHHLTRWLYPFSELPPSAALRATLRTARLELAPAPGETRKRKAVRTLRSLVSPNAPVARGERGLAPVDVEHGGLED